MSLAACATGVSDDPPTPAPPAPPPPPPPAPPPDTPWATSTRTPGTCAALGTCGVEANGSPIPCAANVPASPLDPLAASILASTCPGLVSADPAAPGLACCDAAQVAWLSARLAEASSYIGACPACDAGLRHLWCGVVCGPDQALSWNVSAPLDHPPGNGTTGAGTAAATVWLAPKAAAGLHEACRGVRLGGLPALASLTGGPVSGGAGGWLSTWAANKSSSTHPASPAGGAVLTFVTNPPPPEAVNATAFTLDAEPCTGCGCAACPSAPTTPGGNASTCPAPPSRPPPRPTGCVPLGLGHTRVTCGGLSAAGMVAALAFFFPALASALATAGTPWPPAPRAAGGGGAEPLLGAWAGPPAPPGPPVEAALAAWLARRAIAAADTPWTVVAGAAAFLAVSSLGALFSPSARSVAGLATIGSRAAGLMYEPSPGSRAAKDAAVVEGTFGRAGSVRMLRLALSAVGVPAPKKGGATTSAFSAPALAALFDIHAALSNITAPADALPAPGATPATLRWSDVCARAGSGASPSTSSLPCSQIATPLQWWGLNRTAFDEDVASLGNATTGAPPHGAACADGGWAVPDSGCGPAALDPLTVLGWPDSGDPAANPSSAATVLFVDLSLDGSTPDAASKAAVWEAAVIAAVTTPGGAAAAAAATPLGALAAKAGLVLTLEAERSLGDELAREAFQHRRLHRLGIAGALLAAFWGASLSRRRLGAPPADLLITSRLGLGIATLAAATASGIAGAGLAGWAGVEASAAPFVLASLPVLALATCGDGCVFLVAAFDAAPPALSIRSRLASAFTTVGPALAATTAAQVLALSSVAAFGAPAARGAAAAGALTCACGFFFLVTTFPAALAADARRAAGRRADLAPYVVVPPGPGSDPATTRRDAGDVWGWGDEEGSEDEDGEGTDAGTEGTRGARPQRSAPPPAADTAWAGALPGLTALASLDAPSRLSSPGARAGIAAAAVALLGIAAAALPGTRPGHDPVDALPPSSYLRQYRGLASATRRVGPPLQVVLPGLALTPAAFKAVCGRAPGCAPTSLLSSLAAAAATPDAAAGTYIGAPPEAWVDAFLAWADPAAPGCCSVVTTSGDRCVDGLTGSADCTSCFAPVTGSASAWPVLDADAVAAKLPWFLDSPPQPPGCAVGGAGFKGDLGPLLASPGGSPLLTSRLRTRHTPLRSPSDLTRALEATRATVDAAAVRAGVPAFAWARWHGVAEREARVGKALVRGVLSATLAVAGGVLAVLGCPRTAGVSACATAATGVLALAALRLAGAPLNAASAGAVCVAAAALAGPAIHLCAAYARSSGASEEEAGALYHDLGRVRVAGALGDVGAAVLVGSLASKLAAVLALSFAGSRAASTPLARALVACACVSAFISLALLPAVVLPLAGPDHRQGPGGLSSSRRRLHREGGGNRAAPRSPAPPAPVSDQASVWPADDSAAGGWPADDTGTPPPEAQG